MRLQDSKIVTFLNKVYFYFELGKGLPAKVTNILPEIQATLFIMLFMFGIDIKANRVVLGIWGVCIILGLILLGIWRSKSGLYTSELHVSTNINPIAKIQYEAAKIIVEEYNEKQARKKNKRNISRQQNLLVPQDRK